MLQKVVHKLEKMRIPGLLATAILLVTACGGLVKPLSPVPPTPTLQETTPGEHSRAGNAPHPQQDASNNPVANPEHRVEFQRLSLEQGLSQSSGLCILQDSKGFMWFGTQEGLNKHDGYSFTVYKHDPDDPHSLSDNIIRSLYQDREGVIWIGTANGLNKFDQRTAQFTSYRNDPDDPDSLSHNFVLSLHQDEEGQLWIGTNGGGLDRFDPETERFAHYRNDPRDPDSLSSNSVPVIYQDGEGQLWIGTNGGGLDRFDPARDRFIHYRHDPSDPYSLSSQAVFSIYRDREGVLWVGTTEGLNKFDREREQFIRYQNDPGDPYSLSNNFVLSIHQDQWRNLWVGTNGGGLDRFDRHTERFMHHQNDPADPHSLSSNFVQSIYADRSGVLWIGTVGGGLNKLDPSTERFAHYQNEPNNPNSLSANIVWSIYKDREGILWIGTLGGGLNKYDRASGTFTIYPQNQHWGGHNIYALYKDRDGRFWIGTEEGLYTFYRDTETFRRWMSKNIITCIHEDSTGALWVGSAGGLTRLDQTRRTVTNYLHDPDDPNSLSDNIVQSIYEDRSGDLWIGTNGGLDKFDRAAQQFTHYPADRDGPNSLSYNLVQSIHQDQEGTLWIGTYGGGLDRFDIEKETFTHYREKDGLPSDAIYGILEDDQGNLWLSTNKGLSCFDPQTETFKNYDMRDGLQSNEFNGMAYHKSWDGEMFFGGINGFNAFYPDRITENAYIPPVVLTSLTQSGEDLYAGKTLENLEEVRFHWPNNFFEFEFAALSYCQPDKNRYAYRLEGFDKEWNETGTRRFGRYTNLPGGTYTLRIKGSNNDELWNQEGASIKITVVPPFWGTWWFRGVIGLALVGSVIGSYRLRLKSVEVRNRELETQVEQRTRELEQRTREIERRQQELEALYRADAELHRRLSLDEVLQALVDIAVDILQADKSSLMVWDEKHEQLIVRVARGFHPETLAQMSFAPSEGTAGLVATTGEPVIVKNTHTDPRLASQLTFTESEGIHSFMQVPIQVDDEVFGVFSADYAQPHAFGDEGQRLFIALAQRAALAIDTAQLYEQTQALAVVEERNRLARELHDAVTQTLFSASLIAEVLPAHWEIDQDEGQQLLKELRQLSRGALAEMRTLLLELRPAAMVETNLGDLLRQLGEAVTGRKGIPVQVAIEGPCTLPTDVHVALYRIAQEALNNVVKHARARRVTVSLRCAPSPSTQRVGSAPGEQAKSAELRICDDGRGFDPHCVPPDRLGLGIIRERAQAIDAALEIESQAGQGTKITAVWNKNPRDKERETR